MHFMDMVFEQALQWSSSMEVWLGVHCRQRETRPSAEPFHLGKTLVPGQYTKLSSCTLRTSHCPQTLLHSL